MTFEGDESRTKVDRFLYWAAGARGWSMECRDLILADLKQEADAYYESSFVCSQERRAYWKAVLKIALLFWMWMRVKKGTGCKLNWSTPQE